MKKLFKNIVRNPKTSISGGIGIVLTALLITDKIDRDTYMQILGSLGSIGLLLAKDADKTGVA